MKKLIAVTAVVLFSALGIAEAGRNNIDFPTPIAPAPPTPPPAPPTPQRFVPPPQPPRIGRPSAKAPVEFVSITGKVQVMKGNQLIMELNQGDPFPQDLDSDVVFKVITGTLEVKAAGLTVTGPAGSSFSVLGTETGATISSGEGMPVEVRDGQGNVFVFTNNSSVEAKTGTDGPVITVTQGQVVKSNLSTKETTVMVVGDSSGIKSEAKDEKGKGKDKDGDDQKDQDDDNDQPGAPKDMILQPKTNVIPSQEEKEAQKISPSTP